MGHDDVKNFGEVTGEETIENKELEKQRRGKTYRGPRPALQIKKNRIHPGEREIC